MFPHGLLTRDFQRRRLLIEMPHSSTYLFVQRHETQANASNLSHLSPAISSAPPLPSRPRSCAKPEARRSDSVSSRRKFFSSVSAAPAPEVAEARSMSSVSCAARSLRISSSNSSCKRAASAASPLRRRRRAPRRSSCRAWCFHKLRPSASACDSRKVSYSAHLLARPACKRVSSSKALWMICALSCTSASLRSRAASICVGSEVKRPRSFPQRLSESMSAVLRESASTCSAFARSRACVKSAPPAAPAPPPRGTALRWRARRTWNSAWARLSSSS
mmetsp:Transcript_131273/g.419957  ORF Transcript_131273/g.419957 Transcript_131273/m.419957 type:complete len:276 (-) Transcript_131273:845-1672(-)